VEDLMMTK